MDISKAFDSVNSIMLEKCLKRIKIPKRFINIVIDVAYNRSNWVIVGKDPSDEYYVQDDWPRESVVTDFTENFYDLLLIYLDKIKEQDMNLNVNEIQILKM